MYKVIVLLMFVIKSAFAILKHYIFYVRYCIDFNIFLQYTSKTDLVVIIVKYLFLHSHNRSTANPRDLQTDGRREGVRQIPDLEQ